MRRLSNNLKQALMHYLLAKGLHLSKGTPIESACRHGTFYFDREEEIKKTVILVAEYTMISFERCATLWQQVRYLDRYRIPGAIVECGVWRGGAIGACALAHLTSAKPPYRHLHLFDSFEGLPEPNAAVDGEIAVQFAGGQGDGALRSVGKLSSPISDSRQLLLTKIAYPEELVHYHVGWFQNVVPRDAHALGEIALLRLDGDWYESTVVCLEHLYPKVVKHGVVVVDDYGHFEGCRRAVDEFLASRATPILLNHADYTGRYFVKVD